MVTFKIRGHTLQPAPRPILRIDKAAHQGGLGCRPRPRPSRRTPQGRHGGNIRAARDLLPDPGRSITSIAKLLGVSTGTLYNHIPDLRELRAGAVPHQLEAPTK